MEMSESVVAGAVFWLLAAAALGGAAVVAFSRNIVHSAFALLGTFAGVAGLYALLAADLVAVLQLLIYVGGVLVLILFAVMLTARIDEARVSNRSFGRGAGLFALLASGGGLLIVAAKVFPGMGGPPAAGGPTAAALGDALLGRFILPFEVVSVVLLAALLGGVTLARGRSPRDRDAAGEGGR